MDSRRRRVSAALAAAVVVWALFGCTSTGSSPSGLASVAKMLGEDGLEARITELVSDEVRRRKLSAEVVSSEMPYLRYKAADSRVMVSLIEGAVTKACREYGGSYDDRGNTRSYVLSPRHLGANRADAQAWPTTSGDQDSSSRLSLLMATANETGTHETAAYLNGVCLLKGNREAVLAAFEDRPGETAFDRVRPDAARFYAQPELRRYYWLAVGRFDRYAASVPSIRAEYRQRLSAINESIRPQIEALVAADQAKAHANEQKSAAASAARAAIETEASSRFRAAAAVRKEVGARVCSRDNRLAYVEQIAGTRVKLSVRGRAAGTFEEFGRYGPRSVKSMTGQYLRHDEAGLIEDPNFLFHPLPSTVRFTRAPETIWEQGEHWGVCEYQ